MTTKDAAAARKKSKAERTPQPVKKKSITSLSGGEGTGVERGRRDGGPGEGRGVGRAGLRFGLQVQGPVLVLLGFRRRDVAPRDGEPLEHPGLPGGDPGSRIRRPVAPRAGEHG